MPETPARKAPLQAIPAPFEGGLGNAHAQDRLSFGMLPDDVPQQPSDHRATPGTSARASRIRRLDLADLLVADAPRVRRALAPQRGCR